MGFFSDLFGGFSSNTPTHSSSGSSQPNSPQSQSVNESNQAIQNLIDNKDKYQNNLVAGDNRNEYQMRMNALRTGQTFDPSNFSFTDRSGNQISAGSDNKTIGNAGGAASYADRFPLSNFAMNAGPAIAKTAMGGLFPGGGLIMNALGKARDAGVNFADKVGVGAIVNQGMDFIQDNFMTSGSITEKPEEVDEFRNYLNNLKGLNASAGSGISPLLDTPASATNPINRDGPIQLDPKQIATIPVEEQGLDAFFGGQSQTDSFENFDRRIPPKKTTQDYIDEFNDMFDLNQKKEIFGIEGKEIITPGGVEVSDSIQESTGGITPFNQKSFQEKLEMAPNVYQKLYERMSGEMNMTDAQIEENLRRIGSSPSNMFPYFPFKSGGITRL